MAAISLSSKLGLEHVEVCWAITANGQATTKYAMINFCIRWFNASTFPRSLRTSVHSASPWPSGQSRTMVTARYYCWQILLQKILRIRACAAGLEEHHQTATKPR